MPGPVSDSHPGPADDAPYVPSWCYPKGPRNCSCGHHEGFHAGAGGPCVRQSECGCSGLPVDCWTPDEEMIG